MQLFIGDAADLRDIETEKQGGEGGAGRSGGTVIFVAQICPSSFITDHTRNIMISLTVGKPLVTCGIVFLQFSVFRHAFVPEIYFGVSNAHSELAHVGKSQYIVQYHRFVE